MADRSLRSLELLVSSASTARVLNLRRIGRARSGEPGYAEQPFFQNGALNGSIIVKHRLRPHEIEQFPSPRSTATKILLPIETNDLRLGARYVFIGQRRFEESLFEAFGIQVGDSSRDVRTLGVLDDTPTLDPFLLREQLKLRGIEPALCYFELSPADTQRMFAFSQREIEPLARMSLGSDAANAGQTTKLVQKILANSADAELEPLRRVLQLDPQQFQEGVFCWKAFLYYKWQLGDLLPKVAPVLKQIETIKPKDPPSDEAKLYLRAARETLRKALIDSCKAVKATIAVYDNAYSGLVRESDPTRFRDFLLKSPAMFNELGERLGGIEHMVSFWRFRFPEGRLPTVTVEELSDIFMDFESSLGVARGDETGPARVVAAA